MRRELIDFHYRKAMLAMAAGNECYVDNRFADATKWYKIANAHMTQLGWPE